MKRIIELELYGGDTYRHKKWAKTVTRVDVSKSNGYAFEGEFLKLDQAHELEIGTYILQYGEFGDYRRPTINVQLLKVTQDGLRQEKEWTGLNKSWALGCRDEVAEIVNGGEEVNPLATISTEALLAELARRGVEVG